MKGGYGAKKVFPISNPITKVIEVMTPGYPADHSRPPEMLTGMLGARAMEPSTFRLVGAAMLASAASSLLAYRQTLWDRVKIVVQIVIVWTVLGVLAILWGLMFEGLPAADWMNVLILGAFALAFTYFYSRA